MKNLLPSIEPLEARIAPSTIYALAPGNVLLRFDSATSGAIESSQPITGLGANETLRGIDFRPASSDLYGSTVTTGSAANSVIRTYVIDPATAVATFVGETAAALAGAGDIPTALDFNPVVDRIRYANTNDENARLNPNNGALAGNDTDLSPAATTGVIAGAYDRNFANAPATTLYVIDRNTSTLSIMGGIDGVPSPNAGVVTDLGPLGFTIGAGSDGGFDIESVTGVAFAALTDSADGLTRLYTINLNTGAATAAGLVGTGGTEVRSLAVEPPTAVTFLNATTAAYTDEDGDRVKIKVSKGTLNESDLKFAVARNGGGQLRLIDFSDDGAEFAGANLTITVKKGIDGDGLANVGFIKARDIGTGVGVDLGTVKIQGDLAQIDAGDGISSTTALAKLTVRSLGRYGNVTEVGATDLNSDIFGPLGVVTVAGDVKDASIRVTGTVDADGRVGIITIFGSLIGGSNVASGQLSARGTIGSVLIGGGIIGGTGDESGKIVATGKIGAVTLVRALIGGDGDYDTVPGQEGQIVSSTELGPVAIHGDVVGGAGAASGGIRAPGPGPIASVTVDGSLRGAAGQDSASISTGGVGKLGLMKIGGDVIGGSGTGSGSVVTSMGVGTVPTGVRIGGSLIGGSGTGSGSIVASTVLGAAPTDVKIGGSLIGGSASFTGNVSGQLSLVKIGGDVIGGSGRSAGTIGGLPNPVEIGSVQIVGSLIGGSGDDSGTISCVGAIGSVSIGKDVVGASIDGSAGSVDGSGAIIGGRILNVFIGGSILAGTDTSSGGNLDRNGTIRAENSIGSIVVVGSLVGNETNPIIISARGAEIPVSTGDFALGVLSVGGRVERAQILAGWSQDLQAVNGNASIIRVKVKSDWIASSLVAGIQDDDDAALDDFFGDADDQAIPGFGADALIARIASIAIKGRVIGTSTPTNDDFGFVAQQIGSFRSLGFSAPRTGGLDAPVDLSPLTGDVTLREI